MFTNDKTEEADAIINECITSYEEGVNDALEWFLYTIIGREV